MIQAKFGLNCPSGFRGEDFLKSLQTDEERLQEYVACRDLPTLQFLNKSYYPFWSYCPFFIKISKF
jgi:hypothetical protein